MDHANRNRVGQVGYGIAAVALTADRTLVGSSAYHQAIDPGAADRVLTLPAVSKTKCRAFMVINTGTAKLVTIKDALAATVTAIGPGQWAYVTSNGTIWKAFRAPDLEIPIPVYPHASITTRNLLIARYAMRIISLDYVGDLVQGGAKTGTIVKATGSNAPAKATTPMCTADQIDFNGVAANVLQPLTLTATAADLLLAAGDRVGMDTNTAVSTAAGLITLRAIIQP